MKWTREKVLNRIDELSEEGVASSTSEHPELRRMAVSFFDSWTEACDIVGVTTRDDARSYSDQQILEEIRSRSEDGVAPSASDDKSFHLLVYNRFGSWTEACRKAGVTPVSEANQDRIDQWKTRDDIRDALRARSDGEYAPNSQEHNVLMKAVLKLYDTWTDAVEDAGLKTYEEKSRREGYEQKAPPTDWSREKVVERIREVSEDGEAPSTKEVQALSKVAKNYFDSWVEACRAAGLEREDDRKKWTRKKMIQQLRKDATDGVAPDTYTIGYTNSVIRMFGSWENACGAAGLEPKGHTKNA